MFFRGQNLFMNLETFNAIDEKKNAYQYEQIFSLEEALCKLEKAQKEGTYFRGQADASWKIYSSMQREWLAKGLKNRFVSYQEFIQQFLIYVKEYAKPILKKYCKITTDISIFSTLQHYGAPTPFIDWSSDINVALYFASLGSDLCFGDETNSFISIYWLNVGNDSETPYNDLTRFATMLESHKDNMQKVREENGDIPGSFYAEATEFEIWKMLSALWMEESDDEFMKIANPRSTLQSGAFLYSNEVDRSLDDLFTGKGADPEDESETLNIERVEGAFMPTKSPRSIVKKIFSLPKISCLDIHKTLLPGLRDYLAERSYNSASLGLDDNSWGKNLYQKFLEK